MMTTSATSPIAERFLGMWRRISPTDTGLICYDRSGQMIVQSAPKRERPRAGAKPTPAEALDAITGYVAYFGKYTIDEKAGTVTHHQAATVQPGPAVELVRAFEFVGDNRLILRPVDGGDDIIWERVV